MKKDIIFLPVEGVSIAIARRESLVEALWDVYLLNQNNFPIKDITIRSKGYGEKEGRNQVTSTFRHHFEALERKCHLRIEPIDPAVFHLYNEYWISYFVDGQVYDKKYIFVPDAIIEDNLIFIPDINLPGILHT